MAYPALHTVPVTRVPARDARTAVAAPFRVLNGSVYFSGDCDTCRPFCAAVCCRGYSFVSLTEEEAKSGKYIYKKAGAECGCDLCNSMRAAGLQYVLRKRPDGACIHLDGSGRCSIYENRPETCRNYSCVNLAFRVVP